MIEKIAKNLKDHARLPIMVDATGGWLALYGEWMQDSQWSFLPTKEVHLSSLGKFPVSKESLPILEHSFEVQNEMFRVPPIFAASNIPLFVSARGSVYAPKAMHSVALYFFDMWHGPDEYSRSSYAASESFSQNKEKEIKESNTDLPKQEFEEIHNDKKILMGIGVLRSFHAREPSKK